MVNEATFHDTHNAREEGLANTNAWVGWQETCYRSHENSNAFVEPSCDCYMINNDQETRFVNCEAFIGDSWLLKRRRSCLACYYNRLHNVRSPSHSSSAETEKIYVEPEVSSEWRKGKVVEVEMFWRTKVLEERSVLQLFDGDRGGSRGGIVESTCDTKYTCNIYGEEFNSFQALGGHKSYHHKRKKKAFWPEATNSAAAVVGAAATSRDTKSVVLRDFDLNVLPQDSYSLGK